MNHTTRPTDTGLRHGTITRAIIVAFYDVYNELGPGFLESVYQAAIAHVLTSAGLRTQRETPIEVYFRGVPVGRFFADLVVEGVVVVEVKAVRMIRPEHEAQLIHYLRATSVDVGLLLNFGPSPEFKRLVYIDKRVRPLESHDK